MPRKKKVAPTKPAEPAPHPLERFEHPEAVPVQSLGMPANWACRPHALRAQEKGVNEFAWPVALCFLALYDERLLRRCGYSPEKGTKADFKDVHLVMAELAPICCFLDTSGELERAYKLSTPGPAGEPPPIYAELAGFRERAAKERSASS